MYAPDGKAEHVVKLLVEVHYLPNGKMRYMIAEPDKRKGPLSHKKWKLSGCGWNYDQPTWDDLHKQQYAGDHTGPIGAFISYLKHAAHVLEIRRSNRVSLAKENESR